MYCPNCGSAVPEDGRFCPNCGQTVNTFGNTAVPCDPYTQTKDLTRRNEMAILDRLLNYFGPKQPQYDAFDDACKRVNHYARGAKSALLVWGCIVVGLALLMLVESLINYRYISDGPYFVFGILFLVVGIPMIVGGVLMKVFNRRSSSRAKGDYFTLSVELYTHFYECEDCPIGAEYTNPKILASLAYILQSGRADTIKEAINLLVAPHQAKIARFYLRSRETTAPIHAVTQIPTIFLPSSLFR